MNKNPSNQPTWLAAGHVKLLLTTAIFTVLLIAMGGVLCVTQSIRDCPDWPGCFGKVLPPAETGPILEISHRALAAVSGLLILAAAISGIARTPRLPWIAYPPIAAGLLLILVSYFGARVVLKGLPAGWAAVDVGAALLVEGIMVSTEVIALVIKRSQNALISPDFSSARLAWLSTILVYLVLISGVLVAGSNFITGCVGWPFYIPSVIQQDAHVTGSIIRIVLSILAAGLLLSALTRSRRMKAEKPEAYQLARFVGLTFLLELVVQALLFITNFPQSLLIVYTGLAALFWGLLVAFAVRSSLPEGNLGTE